MVETCSVARCLLLNKDDKMASNHSGHMVTEFEGSFQACLAALTNEDHFNVHDPEEIKAGVEQTLVKFLEMAKQMECFFLQKRLLLSAQKPEQIVREDINDLKLELNRKEQLIQKHYEKIQYWQSLLSNIQGPGPRPPHLQNQIHPPPPHTHTQLQHQLNVTSGPPQLPGPPPHLPPPPPPPPPHLQSLTSGPSVGMGPQSVPSPMSMMQSQGPGGGGGGPMSQNMQVPSPMQGMNPNPSMYGLPPPNPSQLTQQMVTGPPHPGAMHPGPHPGMHSGLQGPLAYLEKTTSNIGMPDPRQ